MKTRCAILVLMFLALAATDAAAKRGAPKDVPPLTRNGIVYSAPHDRMGCVVAKDEKSDRLIWYKQIYVVKYNPELEQDVQDCFITELHFEGDTLLIRNENSDLFELNPATVEVKPVKRAFHFDCTDVPKK